MEKHNRKIELAKKAGFCFGVQRAVDLAYQAAAEHTGKGAVFTYGPIIHNETVVEDLEKKGVTVLNQVPEENMAGTTILLRSHGVSRALQEAIEQTGASVIDAACPFVKKIHHIVQEYSEKGYAVVIIGSPVHSEVEGIRGWSSSDHVYIVETPEAAASLDLSNEENVCIVSQTTFNHNKFKELVEIIEKKEYYKKGMVQKNINFKVFDTICSATYERQHAAADLADKADAMIVIGGAGSSNTRKLYEICSAHCRNTYFIQTKEDLKQSDFSRFDYVGITAGASTPNKIIEEVQKYVRDEL